MASPTPARDVAATGGGPSPNTDGAECLAPAAIPLGQCLIQAGLLTPQQLEQALRIQQDWGSRLGDIVLAMGWVKSLDFYQVLARHFRLEFVNLMEHPADDGLFEPGRYQEYAQQLYLPWRLRDGKLWIATADPSCPVLEHLAAQNKVQLIVTSKFDVIWELQRVAGPAFSRQAVNHLVRFDPQRSAKIVVTEEQARWMVFLALVTLASFWFFPVRSAVLL
ncbi:MAG TPA: hypothetical protein VJQ82_25485, partial [Terriglobales bacterium]|nr:hypothetical protein [Terriglobales bacterium]